MRLFSLYLGFVLGGTLCTQPVRAQARDTEYRSMVERLNKRYEDYFLHIRDYERFEKKRRKGADEVDKARRREEKRQEQARREFVRNRKAAPDTAPLRRAWEAQQRKEAREREKAREAYVQKRDELEKIRSTARKIPEDVASGLKEIY